MYPIAGTFDGESGTRDDETCPQVFLRMAKME